MNKFFTNLINAIPGRPGQSVSSNQSGQPNLSNAKVSSSQACTIDEFLSELGSRVGDEVYHSNINNLHRIRKLFAISGMLGSAAIGSFVTDPIEKSVVPAVGATIAGVAARMYMGTRGFLTGSLETRMKEIKDKVKDARTENKSNNLTGKQHAEIYKDMEKLSNKIDRRSKYYRPAGNVILDTMMNISGFFAINKADAIAHHHGHSHIETAVNHGMGTVFKWVEIAGEAWAGYATVTDVLEFKDEGSHRTSITDFKKNFAQYKKTGFAKPASNRR